MLLSEKRGAVKDRTAGRAPMGTRLHLHRCSASSSRLIMQERGCRDHATGISMARSRVQACGDFEHPPDDHEVDGAGHAD